jgi:tetratricopeptide (TPR) repeat protein
MKNLIQEIHRRSLWQVLGIYLAGGWVALQVVEQVAEAAALPGWVRPLALILLVIGFPIVMATAFVQEGVGGRQSTGADTASDDDSPTSEPDVSAAEPRADVADGRSTSAGVFTWRRAITGGVAAFALLGFLGVGWVVSRSLGVGPAATLVAKGLLDERATVLLADFEAEDESLSRAATEAFKVDLSQSQVVRLAEPSFVRQALARMQQSSESGLSASLAQELAVREGIPAVIVGAINSAGDGYVLTVELRAAGTGDVLVSHRETATDASGLIEALDALSKQLRERIGESVGTMRSEEPLERVTTANLDALRRFSQAVEVAEFVGDDDRAIELLEEAIALDPEFAMAYRKLGAILNNRQEERARRTEALTMAFENQDRLTERERYLAQASYYENVTGERRRAIRAYESMLDLDPEDTYALNNSGIVHVELRDFETAESMYERALAADSSGMPPYFNLVVVQTNQGKWDDAARTIEVMAERLPEAPQPLELRGWLASSQSDYDLARERVEELREDRAGEPYWDADTAANLARLAAVQGRLAEAEEWTERAQRVAADRGFGGQVIGRTIGLAWIDLQTRGDPRAAIQRIDRVLADYPLEDLVALDRPYGGLVNVFAFAGASDRARAMLEELIAEVPEDFRLPEDTDRMEAAIALSEGRYDEAIDGFRRTMVGSCLLCSMDGLAFAYDRAGQADSAIVAYERYLETPFFDRLFFDTTFRPVVLERLGELHDEAGNLQEAARYYASFVELWADADEELQPRVRAAQARLEAILAAIG